MGDALAKTMTESTKFLRKGKRTLNGQIGEEGLISGTLDGNPFMGANAEFYGVPNVLEKPFIKIALTYDPDNDNPQQSNKKSLSEKDFLALWDALLNGIKPRTSSLWGGDSIKK